MYIATKIFLLFQPRQWMDMLSLQRFKWNYLFILFKDLIDKDCPGNLEVIGVVSAGNIPNIFLNRGQCVQITTGSPIPRGSNAVVKVF